MHISNEAQTTRMYFRVNERTTPVLSFFLHFRLLILLLLPSGRIWYMGLCWILRGLKRQQQLTDRRSRWLKEKYLQLFFEEGCLEPMTADAIRIFGGRDWSMTDSVGALSPTNNATLRRRNVKGKKTKSIGNIHALTKVCIFKKKQRNMNRSISNFG